MTTQHQITLPEPDITDLHYKRCYVGDVYYADTVRALLAAAVAKERENQDALLRQALEAFDAVAGKGPLCNAAVKAIQEHLK